MDLTEEQWRRVAEVIIAKRLFCLFDIAYQGFASGDPDLDAKAVRYAQLNIVTILPKNVELPTRAQYYMYRMFVKLGIEMIICQSFAKNFGLYSINLRFCLSP